MDFQIDSASRIPIYRQLCDQIRQAIAQGHLRCDDRLPSVRELSRQVVVNPNTIARAYTELEREGVLNTRPGLGVFVAKPRTDLTRKSRRDRMLEQLDAFLTESVHLGMSRQEVTNAFQDRILRFSWPEEQ